MQNYVCFDCRYMFRHSPSNQTGYKKNFNIVKTMKEGGDNLNILIHRVQHLLELKAKFYPHFKRLLNTIFYTASITWGEYQLLLVQSVKSKDKGLFEIPISELNNADFQGDTKGFIKTI